MERHICIHGHFYQPPRENPWLEAIELQDSAYPFHDWNERIADECYRPNGRSRILDDDGRIERIVNNYSRISFNFGATLLSWLEEHSPDVHEAIVEADEASRARFGGHGSAMAQSYGHIIMPLANERDRRTQVRWGVRDFEHRFGRKPEGMWLSETATNTPTLEVLAEEGIRFTVLAPRQAGRVKPVQGGKWVEAGGGIDPSRAYECRLPSGRSIALFFYDGPISQAVAFEGLLENGQRFAERLIDGFSDKRDWPQLMHIATDGETYGHHHAHGDMALAAALEYIEQREDVKLINYAEFLERHPPTHLVEIAEDSSWSCVHGVDRWRADCGCHTGGQPGWTQAWRAPLREALDWLRDELIPEYERAAGEMFHDPWEARDGYIDVLLDRSEANVDRSLREHAGRDLSPSETVRALKLLELQRHAMLMYTSCGWFFNELSGIETVQVMQYAGRVIQLAEELFERNYEPGFLDRLEVARSNLPEQGTGREIYERAVKPAMIDLPKVGAHFALSSLFRDYGETSHIYCYDIDVVRSERASTGRAQLHVGQVRLTSMVTRESDLLSFGVIYLGEHIMNGAVRRAQGSEQFEALAQDLTQAFERAEFTSVLRMLDNRFGGPSYALGSMFRDEQRKVTDLILESTLDEVRGVYRNVYESHAPLTRFLASMCIPIPNALHMPAEFTVNHSLRGALNQESPDPARLREIWDEARDQSVELDQITMSFHAEHTLHRLSEKLAHAWSDPAELSRLAETVQILRDLPFDIELGEIQNAFYAIMLEHRGQMEASIASGQSDAKHWLETFDRLGGLLNVHVRSATPDEALAVGGSA